MSISRRRSLAIRAARPSLSTCPDLSHISEDADGVSEQEDQDLVVRPPMLDDLREEDSQTSLSQSQSQQRLPTPRSSPETSPATSPVSRPVELAKIDLPVSPLPTEPQPSPIASTSALEPPSLPPQPTVSIRRGARQSWANHHTQAAMVDDDEEAETKALGRIERRAREAQRDAPPKPRPSSKGKGREVDNTLAEERRALREVQKEEVLPPRRRRTVVVPVVSSESEAEAVAPPPRRSLSPRPPPPAMEVPAIMAAIDDSSAAEEDSYVPRPTARRKAGTIQVIEPTSPDRRVETVLGSAGLQRSAKPVSKMESLGEESRTAPPPREDIPQADEPQEGRRARKSVNYALPKLNSKMRRPEDYVPAIKGARKSVVPRAPISRQSVQPTSSSQPQQRVVSRELVPPRPASSQPSAKPASRRLAKAQESGSGDEGEEEEETEAVVVERIKQRRASSLAAAKAMREMEDRLREGDGGGGARAAGRRQSALA